MERFQSPRGTEDVLPALQPYWELVREAARQTAQQFCFQPITLPTYESVGLFQRSIGQGTDVMDKELFLTRSVQTEPGKEEYALRPEATAGMVRAYIEQGMQTWPQPVRLWTIANVFRYDRPQKGRLREHTQFDLEYYGEHGPFADAWIILAVWRFFQILKLEGITIHLNTLGTNEERAAYITAFRTYLQPHLTNLTADSQRRLEINPLRILDSKDAADQDLVAKGPHLSDFLGEASRAHFEQVQAYLTSWDIPFTCNPYLVRGLDYYAHTTFEVTSEGAGGQQSSLGGGGRYDGLVPQLGGPNCGAVGVAIGLERTILELQRQEIHPPQPVPPDAYLIALEEAGRTAASRLLADLLAAGLIVDANFEKTSLSSQLKVASRSGVRYVLIIGGEEATHDLVKVKDLTTGDEWEVPQDDVAARLLTTGSL